MAPAASEASQVATVDKLPVLLGSDLCAAGGEAAVQVAKWCNDEKIAEVTIEASDTVATAARLQKHQAFLRDWVGEVAEAVVWLHAGAGSGGPHLGGAMAVVKGVAKRTAAVTVAELEELEQHLADFRAALLQLHRAPISEEPSQVESASADHGRCQPLAEAIQSVAQHEAIPSAVHHGALVSKPSPSPAYRIRNGSLPPHSPMPQTSVSVSPLSPVQRTPFRERSSNPRRIPNGCRTPQLPMPMPPTLVRLSSTPLPRPQVAKASPLTVVSTVMDRSSTAAPQRRSKWGERVALARKQTAGGRL
mmetsp:Transcript_102102/g.218631  ORF Transcript_102102/g.218631 Transcript_102102/m.218631 type:complete len:305 (+) Transcript_102102:127-1041(+)